MDTEKQKRELFKTYCVSFYCSTLDGELGSYSRLLEVLIYEIEAVKQRESSDKLEKRLATLVEHLLIVESRISVLESQLKMYVYMIIGCPPRISKADPILECLGTFSAENLAVEYLEKFTKQNAGWSNIRILVSPLNSALMRSTGLMWES